MSDKGRKDTEAPSRSGFERTMCSHTKPCGIVFYEAIEIWGLLLSSFKLVIGLLSWTGIHCRCVQGVETTPSAGGPWEGTLWGLTHNDFLSPRPLVCCVPPPLWGLLPWVSWVFIVVFQPLLLTSTKNAMHFLLVGQIEAPLT